jgi:XTP/dITP diphosphohydrolase
MLVFLNKVDESHQLLVGTSNAGKVAELTRLLADLPVRLCGLSDLPAVTDVEETGKTFAENAILKARYYAAHSGLWTLADDSGLEVEALGGAPGVLSARYAGPGASDEERMSRLLAELNATGDVERRARFVCVIAIAAPGAEKINCFTGACDGRIAEEARGSGGFGYDPVFVPDGYTQTFGELPRSVKGRISHRARALAEARAFLRARLWQLP